MIDTIEVHSVHPIGDEVSSLLLEGMSKAEFVTYYLVAVAGAMLFFMYNLYEQLRLDPKGRQPWSWRKFFGGSIRIVMSLISLVFAVLYFEKMSMIMFQSDSPVRLTGWSAFTLGIGFDRIWKSLLGAGRQLQNGMHKK